MEKNWLINPDGYDDVSIEPFINRFIYYTNVENSLISCGVGQITTINSLYNTIKSKIKERYIKQVIIETLNQIKKNEDFTFLLISNNSSNNNLNKILNSICKTQTFWRINPNSGNKIKVWVY